MGRFKVVGLIIVVIKGRRYLRDIPSAGCQVKIFDFYPPCNRVRSRELGKQGELFRRHKLAGRGAACELWRRQAPPDFEGMWPHRGRGPEAPYHEPLAKFQRC